jgi:hypothetical protein
MHADGPLSAGDTKQGRTDSAGALIERIINEERYAFICGE